MFVKPQAKGILHYAGDKRGRLTGRQALFGLPGECASCIFIDRTKAMRSQISSGASLTRAAKQAAELAKLAHGIQQALAQPIDVGAALGCWNQVDVAFLHRRRLPAATAGPIHRFLVARQAAAERFIGQRSNSLTASTR